MSIKFKIHRTDSTAHIVTEESILYATRKHRKLKFKTIVIPDNEVSRTH